MTQAEPYQTQNLREVVGEALLQRQKTNWSKLRGWLLRRNASKWSTASTQQKILELTHKVIEAGSRESPHTRAPETSWHINAAQKSSTGALWTVGGDFWVRDEGLCPLPLPALGSRFAWPRAVAAVVSWVQMSISPSMSWWHCFLVSSVLNGSYTLSASSSSVFPDL